MTLEERVEALEAALASQQNVVKETINSAVQSALRPGGCLYSALKADRFHVESGKAFIANASIGRGEVKAAQVQAAEKQVTFYSADFGITN